MVTLKDVAKQAGVSVATVSCCLSGAKPVKPETKIRIMEAVENLKYIPNAAARNLKQTHSNKIGVVFPDINDSFFVGILKGLSIRMQQNNYIVNIVFSGGNPKSECEKIDELIHENVAGLLIITCQPENTDYFTSRLENYNIPTVFIHNKPLTLRANVAYISNYETMRHFATELLEAGCRDLAVVMGARNFTAEDESLRGVRDAFEDCGLMLPGERVGITNMTKEDAFKSAMRLCKARIPHAILCTSSLLAAGVKEALDIQGLRVPEDVVVATLGEVYWNNSGRLPGVLYSQRAADSLGAEAAKLLLREIQSPGQQEKMTLLFSDAAAGTPLHLPPHRPARPRPAPLGKIRALVTETPSVSAIEMVSRCFSVHSGVEVDFQRVPIRELLRQLESGQPAAREDYDVCMFDSPWTAYIQQSGVLEELTDFVSQPIFDRNHIFKKNMDSCACHGRYYGIPISGGTQIMFYRKDLFETNALIREFRKRYDRTLRPPKTWAEFNLIAEFFTRSVNPDSPTAYGTVLSGADNESLGPQLLLHIWAHGARLWNSAARPTLVTPQMEKAYASILRMLQYVEKSPFEVDISQMVHSFCEGEAAMLVTYTEYTGAIRDSLNRKVIGAVGYEAIPGDIWTSAGWNFGMNRASHNKALVQSYFKWLCQADTSQYITILGGQSTVIQPYYNNEIIGLYPWMELTKQQRGHEFLRLAPEPRRGARQLSTNSIEAILCNALHYMLQGGRSVRQALEQAQGEMEALFHENGYL